MSEDELKKMQKEKLSRLLMYASRHVPYYRKVLSDSGVIQENEVLLKNFTKVPILTKDILKNEFENLKSDEHTIRKSFLNHSGGSTGSPTDFLQDKEYDDWNIANKMYCKFVAGQVLGDKEMRLWGSERDFTGVQESPKIRFRNFIFNRKEVNAFTMTPENMKQYAELINQEKPTLIESYVDAMYHLSLFIERNNLSVYSPKAIITSAGTLYDYMKDKIESVFKTIVWNRYGSREVGDAAFGYDKLRLSVWNHFVDVDTSNDKGFGRIYVTTLNNFSMPLIRYDIGDLGRSDEQWGYLKSIEGREVEAFKTPEGGIIPGLFFVHFFGVVMNNGSIRQFQMTQKSFDEIDIKIIVADKDGFESARPQLEQYVNQVMGYQNRITWIEVDNIPKLPSGKYAYTISTIA